MRIRNSVQTSLALFLSSILLSACQAAPDAQSQGASEEIEAAPLTERDSTRPTRELDELVIEHRVRYSTLEKPIDRLTVEARLKGCKEFAELKAATVAGDMHFTLRSDRGEELQLTGGVGGRSGTTSGVFAAHLVLHPRQKDWLPTSGERYHLIPHNRTGSINWIIADDLVLEIP